MTQYFGLNLCVHGIKIKNPNHLPTLRPAKTSETKQPSPVKEKKPAKKRVKPPPKMLVKSPETQLIDISSGVLPPPPLPPEPLVSIPIETVVLHLPMTVNKSTHLPISAQSPSVSLSKRRQEVSKLGMDKGQLCDTKEDQDLCFPPEITISKPSHQAVTSTLSA